MYFERIYINTIQMCIFFLQDGSEDVNTFTKGNRDNFNPLILFVPAFCDMVATSTMYVGLNLTYASSFQMLRGISIFNHNSSHLPCILTFCNCFALRQDPSSFSWAFLASPFSNERCCPANGPAF